MRAFLYTILFVFILGGCSSERGDGDNVLVTFKGGVLTKEDVAAHLKSLERDAKFKNKEALTPEFAFEHALNMEMIIAKGLEEKLHLDPTIRQRLHQQMSELFLKLMEEQLITIIDRDSITEEEMRDYYTKNLEHYTVQPQYTLHAFTVEPEKGRELAAAIAAGTMTFAEAATAHALDESERAKAGKTGTRSLKLFQPSWQPVVMLLNVGQVDGPREIDGKNWLLLLERKTEAVVQPFEERKAYIKNDVLYSKYQNQWQEVYDSLRKRYEVRVNDKNLEVFYGEMAKKGDNNQLAKGGQQ